MWWPIHCVQWYEVNSRCSFCCCFQPCFSWNKFIIHVQLVTMVMRPPLHVTSTSTGMEPEYTRPAFLLVADVHGLVFRNSSACKELLVCTTTWIHLCIPGQTINGKIYRVSIHFYWKARLRNMINLLYEFRFAQMIVKNIHELTDNKIIYSIFYCFSLTIYRRKY